MNCSANYLLRVFLHQVLQKMQRFVRARMLLLLRFKIHMACALLVSAMIRCGLHSLKPPGYWVNVYCSCAHPIFVVTILPSYKRF
jgi:hypothetical protein